MDIELQGSVKKEIKEGLAGREGIWVVLEIEAKRLPLTL